MKTFVTLTDFHDWFTKVRPEQFSYEARELIFNRITDIEDDCGIEIDFDPIAICCEYGEMTFQEINDSFCHGNEDLFETVEEIEEFLTDNTMYCGRTPQNTFVFQQF